MFFRLSLLSLLFCVHSFAQSLQVIPIADFPLANNFRATVATAFLKGRQDAHDVMSFELKPGRDHIKFFDKRNKVAVDYIASAGAPANDLVILMSGVGGTAQGGLSSYLGEVVSAMGHNVLTIPNPLSWQFTLGGSSTNYPGYVPDDIEDLLPLVKLSLESLKAKGRSFTSFSMVGYSLGGLHTSQLATLLESRLGLPLKKIILVNSPVDVLEGVNTIDGLYDLGRNYSTEQQNQIWGYLIGVAQQNIPGKTEGEKLKSLDRIIKIGPTPLAWIVGDTFRKDLGDIIYVSQQVNDRGVLKEQQGATQSSAREAEARSFSFHDYLMKVAAPEVMKNHPGLTLDQILDNAGLRSQSEKFRSDSRYVFLHATDDFLTTASSREWALATFGPRAIYFDHGGHLGEVWTNEFKAVLAGQLK